MQSLRLSRAEIESIVLNGPDLSAFDGTETEQLLAAAEQLQAIGRSLQYRIRESTTLIAVIVRELDLQIIGRRLFELHLNLGPAAPFTIYEFANTIVYGQPANPFHRYEARLQELLDVRLSLSRPE